MKKKEVCKRKLFIEDCFSDKGQQCSEGVVSCSSLQLVGVGHSQSSSKDLCASRHYQMMGKWIALEGKAQFGKLGFGSGY